MKERKSNVFTDPISRVARSGEASRPACRALSEPCLNETANKRPQCLQTHHASTHAHTHKSQPSNRERNKEKRSKGRKGMLRKDEERQRQMEEV